MTKEELFEIYETIDPSEPQKYGCRIAPKDFDQRQAVREDDTQRLTTEYLKVFKRETEGLTEAELVDYIDGMKMTPPKPSFEATPMPHVNTATYKAQRNFFVFVQEYRKTLEATHSDKDNPKEKPIFQVTSVALACLAMTKAGLKPELTETKANKAASKYGYFSKTSGRDLMNSYNFIRDFPQVYKRQASWDKLFKETTEILKPYPKALEALDDLKSKFKERQRF